MENKHLVLLKKNKDICIYVSDKESSGVQIAAKNLIRDIELVCGGKASISNKLEECSIVIGTINKEESITKLIKDKKLSVDSLKKEDGSYHWEGFLQQVVDDVFYIMGTNRRGTIYGIYDLCEEIGVSPWYYWADVPVKKKSLLTIPYDFIKTDWPSVAYRGIFINDEEELDDWAKLHTLDGTIGPTTYAHLYELLLRLKGNYIWPAMHVNCFNENSENGALADRMGIVVGTSHCDMLLRSNQNEWEPWIQSKGYTDAVYDYSIEGPNREILQEYWRESVEHNKDYEVCYTMGMRGIHDSGFITSAIDHNTTLSQEEKNREKVALLGQVIKDQKQILRDVLGEEREKEALKTFIPYKEVLSLYDANLELPEDLTLVWANDNFGYMRRYPNESERKRRGGNGLYYHASYWAHPGTGMSYLFINSTPLAHMANELKKSYESGIEKVWVLNVGGLKPVEQDMEFFIRFGWEAGKETGLTKDTDQYTKHWINKNFSGNHGDAAAKLYETFAQVTNVRKVEHMKTNAFSQTAYGDEAGRRLMKLEDIFRKGNDILNHLPEEEKPAFFQLFLMKIHASYYANHEFYYADRSILSYGRGNMQAADKYVEYSVRMLDYKRTMLHYYNKKMSDGKWNGMMTPESFPPPPTAMYPTRKPALEIKGSRMRVDLWNNEESLCFSVYGQKNKWIELGNQGEGTIPFAIEIIKGSQWISLSEEEGILETEKRILVSVVEPKVHAGKEGLIAVYDKRNNQTIEVKVQVEEDLAIPTDFIGYVEADGYLSMEAEGYHTNIFHNKLKIEDESCGWVTVPGMGRYEGAAMMAWNSSLSSLNGAVKENPYLEYQIYVTQSGQFTLEVYRFLTLNSTGKIRFGIGIDDGEPMIVESEIRDEWVGNWNECIMDNGEKILVELPELNAGIHSLKLYMIDHYVTISKLVLYTKGKKTTNLGPITSYQKHMPIKGYELEAPGVDWEGIDELRNTFYQTTPSEVALPNILYTDKEYYKSYNGIGINHQYQQVSLGEARYEKLWKCTEEKDVIKEFGRGMFIEENGVIAIEAEYALENSKHAFLTPSQDGDHVLWTHLQAETDGRTGLAMHVEEPNLLWNEPQNTPGMHYRIKVYNPGIYGVWMLIRHHNDKSDSCYIAMDGQISPLSEQFKDGNMHTYSTAQVYYWCYFNDIEVSHGEHLFSVLARKSQLRVDRIYLTKGEELPPVDALWKESNRK